MKALESLLAVVLVAAVAPMIAAVLPGPKVPQIVVLILAGILIGPSVLGLADTASIKLLANIGLGFLFLLAGYELDPRLFKDKSGRLAMLGWAASAVLAVAAVGVLGRLGLVRDFVPIGLALTTTALGTLLPILQDNDMLGGRFGRYVVAAGAVGELFPIVAISLFLTRRNQFVALASLLAVGAAALLLTTAPRIIGKRRLNDLVRQGQRATAQTTLRGSIVLLVLLLVAAERFGDDVVLGAILAGMVLRSWTRRMEMDVEHLEDKLDAVGYGIFIPIFFVSSGMTLDIKSILADPARMFILLGLLLLVRGLPSLLIYARVLPAARRVEMTFITATTMPLLIALAEIGLSDGVMIPSNAAALVGAGVLSVLIFPAIATALHRRGRSARPGSGAAAAGGNGGTGQGQGPDRRGLAALPHPARGDERGELAQALQRVEVEVLAGHVDAVAALDLAQQAGACQRVESGLAAEQRHVGGQRGQLRVAGDVGQQPRELGLEAHGDPSHPDTQSGRLGSGPASGRLNSARPSAATAPGSARRPAAASASRIGTFRSVTRHGTVRPAAPPRAAARHSHASSASSTPRPSARQLIMTTGTGQDPPSFLAMTAQPTVPSSA